MLTTRPVQKTKVNDIKKSTTPPRHIKQVVFRTTVPPTKKKQFYANTLTHTLTYTRAHTCTSSVVLFGAHRAINHCRNLYMRSWSSMCLQWGLSLSRVQRTQTILLSMYYQLLLLLSAPARLAAYVMAMSRRNVHTSAWTAKVACNVR